MTVISFRIVNAIPSLSRFEQCEIWKLSLRSNKFLSMDFSCLHLHFFHRATLRLAKLSNFFHNVIRCFFNHENSTLFHSDSQNESTEFSTKLLNFKRFFFVDFRMCNVEIFLYFIIKSRLYCQYLWTRTPRISSDFEACGFQEKCMQECMCFSHENR